MAFENWKVRLHMLLEEATYQPEDLHELQEALRAEVAELQAQGLPVPADIAKLEERLEAALSPPKT
ncbi:MAG: hypothetical protein L3J37_09725 [Rhodobacteraceae bacterium]|nr:hypothetical protein [Paracoccaceae bacterium]